MAAKTIKPRKVTERDRRAALEAIQVVLTGEGLKAYREWRRRADVLRERWIVLTPFGTWYPPAREAWVEAAVDAGLWEPSDGHGYCSHTGVAGSQVLGQLRDVHGRCFDFTVEETARTATLVVRFCGKGESDAEKERSKPIYTNEMRLTAEEIRRGDPCKGCGRPIFKPGSWAGKGTMYYTSEEAEAARIEDEEWTRLHADCHSARWGLSGSVVQHCFRCCPPPPLPDESIAALARLFRQSADEDARRKQRWDELGRRPKKSAPPKPKPPDPVERLRAEAARLGYELILSKGD